MRMKDLKGCTVVLGPVSGSVFIDNCSDCTFTIASQQQRIHNTHRFPLPSLFTLSVLPFVFLLILIYTSRCTIFTCCTSQPIIETCSQLLFGTYNIIYDNQEADFKVPNHSPSPVSLFSLSSPSLPCLSSPSHLFCRPNMLITLLFSFLLFAGSRD